MQLIDSHCHMDMVLNRNLSTEEVFDSMEKANITNFVQIAADLEALNFVDLVNKRDHPVAKYRYPLRYTIGMHPGEVHERDSQILKNEIFSRVSDTNFCAVGEIGLDYYYAMDHKEEQLRVFEDYLAAAVKVNKPVCIHTRDAHQDTLRLLTQYSKQLPDILIHCFTGGVMEINDYLEIGCYISFSGIVTFKSAEANRAAAKVCPIDRLLVETDAPYLAPVPYRGKVNHPGYLPATVECLSTLKEISVEDLSSRTVENTIQFYRL